MLTAPGALLNPDARWTEAESELMASRRPHRTDRTSDGPPTPSERGLDYDRDHDPAASAASAESTTGEASPAERSVEPLVERWRDGRGRTSSPAVLGQRIWLLRRLREIKQQDLAVAARITDTYLRQLERGQIASPSFPVLLRLAVALGVPDPSELAFGQEDDYSQQLRAPRGPDGEPLFGAAAILEPPEAARATGPRLPVYRTGQPGDPRDASRAPAPEYLDHAPLGREAMIGKLGWGVLIPNDRLTARAIGAGDVVWCRPGGVETGRVIIAGATRPDGTDAGMQAGVLEEEDGAPVLYADSAEDGRYRLPYAAVQPLGLVVAVQSVRAPR